MKLITTTLILLSLCFMSFGQDQATNEPQSTIEIPSHIEALYAEGRALDMDGTAEEINQNRLDIIEAWQLHNPEVAALYNSGNQQSRYPDIEEYVHINGEPTPGSDYREMTTINAPEDWGPDLLIREGFVDGVDMEVNGSTIYIAMYENLIDFGGTRDSIFIFRSDDGGSSWTLWDDLATSSAMRKMQLVVIGPGVDSHICVYALTASNTFQVFIWKESDHSFMADVIDTDVMDFAVDRNYPAASSQRVFASYLRDGFCSTQLWAARSTAGSFGKDWVDQSAYNGICVEDVDLAYGRDGGVYVTNTGAVSGNLYAHVNDNFADPASWAAQETLELGSATETSDPQIIATRNGVLSDKVLTVYSYRPDGSSDGNDGRYQTRENAGAFGTPTIFQNAIATLGVDLIDLYSAKINGNNVVQGAYIRNDIDNSIDDLIRYKEYDGSSWAGFDVVSDTDVSDLVAPAVAVNASEPILSFAGSGSFGLYFNSRSGITGVDDALTSLGYSLGQNFPNPVQSFTQFGFHLTESKDIRIVITDVLGREVTEVTNEFRSAGDHIIYWEPNVAAGTYFYQLQIDGSQITKKMVVQ